VDRIGDLEDDRKIPDDAPRSIHSRSGTCVDPPYPGIAWEQQDIIGLR
jgi:hypothetical protein